MKKVIRRQINKIIIQMIIPLTIIASCSGCASSNTGTSDLYEDETGNSSPSQEGQALVPVARFTELPMDLGEADWLVTGRNALYYGVITWNKERKLLETLVYQWKEGDTAPFCVGRRGGQCSSYRCRYAVGSGA